MWAVTFGTARRGLHWELQFLNPEKGPKSEKNDASYQKAGYGPARGFSPVPVVIPVECLQREVCPRIVLASPVCHVLVHEMVVYLNDSRWPYRRLVLSFASTIAQTGGITVSTPWSYLVIKVPNILCLSNICVTLEDYQIWHLLFPGTSISIQGGLSLRPVKIGGYYFTYMYIGRHFALNVLWW